MLDKKNRGPVAIKGSPVHHRSEVEMSEGDAVFDAAPELAAATPVARGPSPVYGELRNSSR